MVDPFSEKIDELVDRSRAHVRADVVHGVLVAMGYEGSYRTTRRAVAEAARRWRQRHGRRPHRATRQPPLMLLEQEHEHLHQPPRVPHMLCFGQTRKVDRQATVSLGEAIYSVPTS